MKLSEFVEQDNFCKMNNVPEGKGCEGCPAIDKSHCADALRNLVGKLVDSLDTPEFNVISKQLDKDYGITPYHQLVIFKGILEFPS